MNQNNQETKDAIDTVLNSRLDQTIKDILIADLSREGLTPFLKEQIKNYCNE